MFDESNRKISAFQNSKLMKAPTTANLGLKKKTRTYNGCQKPELTRVQRKQKYQEVHQEKKYKKQWGTKTLQKLF